MTTAFGWFAFVRRAMRENSSVSTDELFGGFHGYTEGMLNNLVPSAQAKTRKR